MAPFTQENAARLGRKGGKIGGKARAKKLDAEDRKKIARMGGLARQRIARETRNA